MIPSLVSLSVGALFFLNLASADQTIPLLQFNSTPSPQMQCRFDLTESLAGEIMQFSYECTGEDLDDYGVDKPLKAVPSEIRSGIVFMKHKTYKVNIIIVSSPDLDIAHGGLIKVKYLKNAATGNYDVFRASLEKIGSKWVVYTTDEQGKRPITELSVTTYLLGVKSISSK